MAPASKIGRKKNGTTTLASDPMSAIVESARQGKLVCIVGSGVSLGLTNSTHPPLGWKGLVENGFEYALKKGRLTADQKVRWQGHLESDDIDDLLGAAEFVGRKLGATEDALYATWLKSVFGSVQPESNALSRAIKALFDAGIPICTLNYDTLLEAVTGAPTVELHETYKVNEWMRAESASILHLHGTWQSPKSCVLGIRDYEATLKDDVRDLIQRSLAAFSHLLFIGCGDTFSDPNFSALTGWLKSKLKGSNLQHIALVRQSEVPRRNADPAWAGFVDPISFGVHHDDLPSFLLSYFPVGNATSRARSSVVAASSEAAIIEAYRAYLLKDCGQMTIEGVRADMDTAQRRFDLEKLFVPLQVLACPPEFPADDPQRETKLAKWMKKNQEPVPFGQVFSKGQSLALLALPGGGKTLLLKRIAVAYADPRRRAASSDELPDSNFIPLLIRCREWRAHIALPISTLLSKLPEITGQESLSGLAAALVPHLEKGRVLLLIDGLDEIHNDAERATFVEHLESFLETYKLTRVVVTSREAGFNLVAPSLSRFCQRWRLAPLYDKAIISLCGHWHRLMSGDSPEAIADGSEVAQLLLRSPPLRRLAENPLLLTMLLVVKRGAGRLPPDRVSLYERAVEVLLDTWNIKGHSSLSPKEAVPQLAFVAFKLMLAGKQTATEKELVSLLEEAREHVPQIKRYAKDSAHEFLKKVELRSSLLLEAGRQLEGGVAVPFYQFRHLTFQEYLAAVAVSSGAYEQYSKGDSVLTPLREHLVAPEWKEVIPMAAVLARNQADPLIAALVSLGTSMKNSTLFDDSVEQGIYLTMEGSSPAPIARLAQCLVEEAEATPETLAAALALIAYCANGAKHREDIDWSALCKGPYGSDLFDQALAIYFAANNRRENWIMHTCASFAVLKKPAHYWSSGNGKAEVTALLESRSEREVCVGLFVCMGAIWGSDSEVISGWLDLALLNLVEKHLFNSNPDIWVVALWTWTNGLRRVKPLRLGSLNVLDRLLSLFLTDEISVHALDYLGWALTCQLLPNRNYWAPKLTEDEKVLIRTRCQQSPKPRSDVRGYTTSGAVVVAYFARNVWSDKKLIQVLKPVARELRENFGGSAASQAAFDEMLWTLEGKRGLRSGRTSKK